jgi:hypothetical protein
VLRANPLFDFCFWLFFTSQQNYKAEYEDIKTRCFFPQTITPEYEVDKKLAQCKDVSHSPVPVIGIL